MQKNKISDKQVLYSLISREVSNILRQVPFLGLFEDSITGFLLQIIDPYINAFIGNDNRINSEQLSKFVSQEAVEKIQAFKEKYEREAEENNENKSNI